jgi:hypothetical protein
VVRIGGQSLGKPDHSDLFGDGGIRVRGRLVGLKVVPMGLLTPYPEANRELYVKIFRRGTLHGHPPFKTEQLVISEIEGNFAVRFDPPPPEAQTVYVINILYPFTSPLFGSRWAFYDFQRPSPSVCG